MTARFFNNILMIVVGTGMFAYLAGGVVAGMVWCTDCDGVLGNTLGRLLSGAVVGVLSAVHGGFPPNLAGNERDAWPFIFGCWAVLFVAALVWFRENLFKGR
jgi:hypothetical protein